LGNDTKTHTKKKAKQVDTRDGIRQHGNLVNINLNHSRFNQLLTG
jgi:hypothetical protein